MLQEFFLLDFAWIEIDKIKKSVLAFRKRGPHSRKQRLILNLNRIKKVTVNKKSSINDREEESNLRERL